MEITRRETRPVVLLERARGFAELGDLTRAEQYLTAALENGADPDVVVPQLVSICVTDQRYRAGAEYLENHLRRHPNDHGLRYVLATLYAGIGDTESARVQLERVVLVVPDHAEAHFALAVLNRDAIGNYSEADRRFRRYLELKPEGPHAEEARDSLLVSLP